MSLPSLRRRMLWRVLWPLAATWLLGGSVAVAVALIYTGKAFDRSLLDDAYAISANVSAKVRAGDGVGRELDFQLTPREVGAVLFDREEKVFFTVLRADGSVLAGQGGLYDGDIETDVPIAFSDRHYRGLDLRMVTLWRSTPIQHVVVVAQTTRSRQALVEQLLAWSVAPQVVLLMLLWTWLRHSIGRELEPLQRLEQTLEQRNSNDLTPLQVAPTSRDIELLARAFNDLMSRIAAGVQMQREFAGNVAHELRTPLAGIRLLAEYGLAQKDPAAWQRQLSQIVASGQRASHLVDQLLALALADEARESLELEPVAVDALVRELLLRLLPRADAAGVDLGAEGLDRPLWALATATLVEGLLVNLIDNALRYGRPTMAGVTPRVTVAAAELGADLLLSVADNGPGMDSAECERVLARWGQGSTGAARGSGFGLGLAIATRYAALLGGRLVLGPVPGGPGLRATVWLPRASPPGSG